MAQKSILLYGLVLLSVLLVCQDMVYASELTEANVLEGKTIGSGLTNENFFGGYFGGRRRGFGGRRGYNGGFGQPGFGPGLGGPYQPGYRGGFSPYGGRYNGYGFRQPFFGNRGIYGRGI